VPLKEHWGKSQHGKKRYLSVRADVWGFVTLTPTLSGEAVGGLGPWRLCRPRLRLYFSQKLWRVNIFNPDWEKRGLKKQTFFAVKGTGKKSHLSDRHPSQPHPPRSWPRAKMDCELSGPWDNFGWARMACLGREKVMGVQLPL